MAKAPRAANEQTLSSLTDVLSRFRRPDRPAFADAWVGMEPTFQSRKSVEKWHAYAAKEGGEDAYFLDRYMLGTQKRVAKAIEKRFSKRRREGAAQAFFARVERQEDVDPWKVKRQNLHFHWANDALPDFEVRFTLDPETFEFSIKPVPLAWFEDERFVAFVEEFVFRIPQKHGLAPSVAHGGCQFSLSAKTYLQGSLLADELADRLNHPELSTWLFDWPNPDDRSFRATTPRFDAFRRVLAAYWEGRFHPKAKGYLTAENAFFDRGFEPSAKASLPSMQKGSGPAGDARDVFQTNFGFGRAVRLFAQSVHPGYWQAAHPKEDGYRPDQIMRYSEGNLNRLQIAGEWHVKSGKPLQPERAPALTTVLEVEHLTDEASVENRGQMGRTSGRDFVEALLLSVNRARHLALHPRVKVRDGLAQDALSLNAEKTVEKYAGAMALSRLRREARKANLDASRGRLRSDFIEPEALFWAAFRALPKGQKAEGAREVVEQFATYVKEAAAADPRKLPGDPMEWHRHRVHPALWSALSATKALRGVAGAELAAFSKRDKEYLARRPIFSHLPVKAPWDAPTRAP